MIYNNVYANLSLKVVSNNSKKKILVRLEVYTMFIVFSIWE